MHVCVHVAAACMCLISQDRKHTLYLVYVLLYTGRVQGCTPETNRKVGFFCSSSSSVALTTSFGLVHLEHRLSIGIIASNILLWCSWSLGIGNAVGFLHHL